MPRDSSNESKLNMKSYFRTLSVLLGAVFALAGCSSTPTKVDKGPIHAATFSFVSGGVMPDAEFAEKRQAVHALIQEAIVKDLTAKGLKPAAADRVGDVTVAYLIILGNNVTTTAINDYFGYNRNASALLDKAHKAYTEDNSNPNYFEAGTLVIDLIDSRNYELLKRGYVVRPVLRNVSEEVRRERIQDAVDEVLKNVKIAP
jgi:hypothetical protein